MMYHLNWVYGLDADGPTGGRCLGTASAENLNKSYRAAWAQATRMGLADGVGMVAVSDGRGELVPASVLLGGKP